MNAIPGYDAWRLAGPPEPPRPACDTVQDSFTVNHRDLCIEGTGNYDAETGDLVSIDYAGREIPVAILEALVGSHEVQRLCLSNERLTELCIEAAASEADARGDYLYDQRSYDD